MGTPRTMFLLKQNNMNQAITKSTLSECGHYVIQVGWSGRVVEIQTRKVVWRLYMGDFECQSEEFICDIMGKQEGIKGFCFFFSYGSSITATFALEKIILTVM